MDSLGRYMVRLDHNHHAQIPNESTANAFVQTLRIDP